MSVKVRVLPLWALTTEREGYSKSVFVKQDTDDVPFLDSDSLPWGDLQRVVVGFYQFCDVDYVLANQLIPAQVEPSSLPSTVLSLSASAPLPTDEICQIYR